MPLPRPDPLATAYLSPRDSTAAHPPSHAYLITHSQVMGLAVAGRGGVEVPRLQVSQGTRGAARSPIRGVGRRRHCTKLTPARYQQGRSPSINATNDVMPIFNQIEKLLALLVALPKPVAAVHGLKLSAAAAAKLLLKVLGAKTL